MKRLLQVCFIAAMVFGLASCAKDDTKPTGNGSGTGTGEIPTSLVGTTWSWSTDGGGSLQFVSDSMAVVTVNNYHNHGDSLDRSVPKGGVFYGTYTYSNGNGTLWLYIDGRMMEVHFTVSGNTLTATGTPDGDVVMTLVGGNPQPGPNPGGDYPLNGTEWQCTESDSTCSETYQIAFGTTNCHLAISSTCHDNQESDGTYVYDGTVTSGRGTITISGGKSGSFVVNGQEAIITADSSRTMTFYRTRK